jgi:hypothetical protein
MLINPLITTNLKMRSLVGRPVIDTIRTLISCIQNKTELDLYSWFLEQVSESAAPDKQHEASTQNQ